MRYLRLYVLGLGFVVLSALWAWNKIDLTLNYLPVTASVMQVIQSCRLEKSGDSRDAIHEMPCDKAMAAAQTQQFQDYTLEAGNGITYNYVSPVDSALHSGRIWLGQNVAVNRGAVALEDTEVLPGQPIGIYASKSRAQDSKYVPRR